MLNKIRMLCFCFIICFSQNVFANKITVLKKDKKAPFSGYLLTAEALLKLRQAKINEKNRCNLEIQYIKSNVKINRNFALELCKNNKKNTEKRLKGLLNIQNKEIKFLREKAVKGSGINLVPLWITLGFIGGAAITVAVVYGLVPAVQNFVQKNNNLRVELK